jgi:ribosomal protein S18 acetylase RimI-like enzyme
LPLGGSQGRMVLSVSTADRVLPDVGESRMEIRHMHHEVVVRKAVLDDYDSIVGVWLEAGLPFRPEGRDSRESIRVEMGRGCSVFLLAELDGRSVGAALGTHDGRKGWVNRLAVVPECRRLGLARRLVREVEIWLESQGIQICAALIESENQDSRAFFAGIGYLRDPEIQYFSKRRSQAS